MADTLQMEYYLFKGQVAFCSTFVLESACVRACVRVAKCSCAFLQPKAAPISLLPNKDHGYSVEIGERPKIWITVNSPCVLMQLWTECLYLLDLVPVSLWILSWLHEFVFFFSDQNVFAACGKIWQLEKWKGSPVRWIFSLRASQASWLKLN